VSQRANETSDRQASDGLPAHALQEHQCSCADRDHHCDRDNREQYAEYYTPEDYDSHRDEREGDSGIL